MKEKLLKSAVFLFFCCLISSDAYLYSVGIKNATDGVKIYISAESNSSSILIPYSLDEQHLSPACGDDFFRCKLFTTGRILGSIHYYIIAIPLVEKIGFLELRYDGKEMSLYKKHVLEIRCNSTGLMDIQGHYYAVCVGWNSISVYQVLLNSDSIEDTLLFGDNAAAELLFPDLDPSMLSNFEYVGMEGDLQGIYFSIGQELYALNPIDHTNKVVGNVKCDVVNLLVYAGNQTLVAYCRNETVVYFNLASGRWHNQTDPNDEYPFSYVCNNSDVHLAISPKSNSMEYGIWSQNKVRRIDLPGTDIEPMSGVCSASGTGGNTLFAFGDQKGGVFVMNISLYHDTAVQLSSHGCQDLKCHPLIFDNRYIVVREEVDSKHSVLVFDSAANFTIIIKEAVHADLVTLIRHAEALPLVTIEPPPEGEETSSRARRAAVIATTIVISLIIIIVIVALVAGIVVHVQRRRENCLAGNSIHQRNDHGSMEHLLPSNEGGTAETSFNDGDRDLGTPNILEDVDDQDEDTGADTTANELSDDSHDDPPTLSRTDYHADGISDSLSGGTQQTVFAMCTDDLPRTHSLEVQVHHAEETGPPQTSANAPILLGPVQQTPHSDSTSDSSVVPSSGTDHDVMGTAVNSNESNSNPQHFSYPHSESASAPGFVALSEFIDIPSYENAVPSNVCVPGKL